MTSVAEQYKKLETRVSRGLARMQDNLGRRFNELLNPRGREPKWEEWLETLESLLSRMQSLKMKETENSRVWFRFLEDKLEAHGNDGLGRHKGAFATEAKPEPMEEDAPESEGKTTEPQHLPSRRGAGGKRRFSQRDSFSSSTSPIKGQCAACGHTTHPLDKCWTTFPETAPKGYKQNGLIQRIVERQISEDPSLRKRIEKLISEVKSGVENEFVSKSLTKAIKKVGEKGVCFFVGGKTAFNAGNKDSYPLQHSTLLDSGSTEHVCNEISRFLNFQAASAGDFLLAGDSKVPILGYGDVDIGLQTRSNGSVIGGIHGAVSTASRKESNDEVVAYFQEHHGQYTVEHIPSDQKQMRQVFFLRRNLYNSWTKRRPLEGKPKGSRSEVLVSWNVTIADAPKRRGK
ncbi:hypothetical protein ACJ73_05566 [Blastomyces percursus]|uniref:Retrovirus-related Pol polyprotein from transposon TNT 1-94-like beta-barrel domain-containing protein n=1 Tax=Blastomyces percursus TaxID=1658174 RepID=A0A1J9R3K1_9EURO|nr:hypothetical protein ACJ73_05566 [Blastomyces percursus]